MSYLHGEFRAGFSADAHGPCVWQDELARRAGISRAPVSAIEIQHLVPSVAAGLSLAAALDCRVEDLFGNSSNDQRDPVWAWQPIREPCRFWRARLANRIVLFPVESTASGVVPHDGRLERGTLTLSGADMPENTLVMASCDPAAGLLVNQVAAASGIRLIVLQRSSRHALELMRDGLVHLAGIHLATTKDAKGNIAAANAALGPGYSLLSAGSWQEGVAVGSSVGRISARDLSRSSLRWVGRDVGSGARLCQDELLHDRPTPRRVATKHRGVAESIRCGFADVGVCVRLVCEDAGLNFIKVRDEACDLCFPTALTSDTRFRTVLSVVRSANYRRMLADLPGYDSSSAGEICQL